MPKIKVNLNKQPLPGSSGKGIPVCSLDTDVMSDEIIRIADPNRPVKFKLLTENYNSFIRVAGFYNVNTKEDIELKLGQTHNDTFYVTMNDLNNGWVRYGIDKREKNILYVSGSEKEYLLKAIKYIEKKYPEEVFDQYDLEVILGDVSEPFFISLDSNKQPLHESHGQWILSMRNVAIMMNLGFMDEMGNLKILSD